MLHDTDSSIQVTKVVIATGTDLYDHDTTLSIYE